MKSNQITAADNTEMVKKTSERYAEISKARKKNTLTRDEFLEAMQHDKPRGADECNRIYRRNKMDMPIEKEQIPEHIAKQHEYEKLRTQHIIDIANMVREGCKNHPENFETIFKAVISATADSP